MDCWSAAECTLRSRWDRVARRVAPARQSPTEPRGDLRSTFASDALAAGVPVFALARIMGTSVRMIERHCGALLDGAGADIVHALDTLDAQRDQVADANQ